MIADSGFAGAIGAIRVNEAAGDGNVQANVTRIVTAGQTLPAPIQQQTSASNNAGGTAVLAGHAFSEATGVVQLNQAAGTGNAQANEVNIIVQAPADALNDAALASVQPLQTANGTPTTSQGTDTVTVTHGAFSHASGIVQVNQSAGTANRTANVFLLQTQRDAGH